MYSPQPAPPPQVMYATGVPVDARAVTHYDQQGIVGAPYEGAYVHEAYVGPLSIVLGCCLLGPILCPLVFFCPVRFRRFRETTRRARATTDSTVRDGCLTDDDDDDDRSSCVTRAV